MRLMSKLEKLVERFKSEPKDFTWDEMVKLLHNLGFEDVENSKTGGSRRKFYNMDKNIVINLHKPHPRPYISYMLQQVIAKLTEEKML
jgi:hypothetical protein